MEKGAAEVSPDDLPLTVSTNRLTFGLRGRHAAVDAELTEMLTLSNKTKDKYSWKFAVRPVPGKFSLTFEPNDGRLSSGKGISILVPFPPFLLPFPRRRRVEHTLTQTNKRTN